MLDQKNTMRPVIGLAAAVRTETADGASIDRLGSAAVTLLFYVGAGGITFDGTNSLSLAVQHSDDGTTWSNCAETDLIVGAGTSVVNGVVRTIAAAHAAPALYSVGYRGGKKFVRGRDVRAGTHGTGTMTAVVVILGGLYTSAIAG